MSEKAKKKKKGDTPTKAGGEPIHAVIVYVPSEIQLKEAYHAYGVWRNLPPILRELTPVDLKNKFGIEDELILRLLTIHTISGFAQEFGVNRDTLYEWNKKLDLTNPMDWIAVWAKHTSRNIALAMIQNAMKSGGTAFVDRQTFYKTITGYEEKSRVHVEGLAEGILAALKAKKAK